MSRGWTARVAIVDVPNSLNRVIDPAAEITLDPPRPVLTFLTTGAGVYGAVFELHRAGDDIMAAGTVDPRGERLIKTGVWYPEIQIDKASLDGAVRHDDGLVVLRRVNITSIVLGGLPTWAGLWIRLDDEPSP